MVSTPHSPAHWKGRCKIAQVQTSSFHCDTRHTSALSVINCTVLTLDSLAWGETDESSWLCFISIIFFIFSPIPSLPSLPFFFSPFRPHYKPLINIVVVFRLRARRRPPSLLSTISEAATASESLLNDRPRKDARQDVFPLLGILCFRRLLRLGNRQQTATSVDTFLHGARLGFYPIPTDVLPLRLVSDMHSEAVFESVQDTVGLDWVSVRYYSYVCLVISRRSIAMAPNLR